MIVQDIRVLIQKLNETNTKALERAVGSCLNRGQYEVRWEHVLLELLDLSGTDIPCIMQFFNIDSSALRKALNHELDSLRSGNTGKPSFSPIFLEAMELAWNYASLNFGQSKISSGVLFIAAFEKSRLSITPYIEIIQSINIDILKSQFSSIVKSSLEYSPAEKQSTKSVVSNEAGEEILRQYCTNFTDDAKNGKIDTILGRDDEIRQALDILNRRRKNNPILVGEAGVGKTAVVEGIALRIAHGDVPDNLKNVDLWGLDLGLLQAGASVKGEFEKRLKGVIEAIKNSAKKSILFIDEAHTLIGAGGAAGQNDAANLLKPALARGELRTLAATTWAEYRKYFEKDPALARRFQLIKVEEPSEENCSIMLRGIAQSYEKHHGVRISQEGIKAAVTYSHRYISGRQLPDKAVDVLDTACTRVKMSQNVKPAILDSLQRALTNAELELKAIQKDIVAGIEVPEDAEQNCKNFIETTTQQISELTEKWESEKKMVAEIVDLQTNLVTLKESSSDADQITKLESQLDEKNEALLKLQGENPMVFPHVNAAVCAQVISDWTGIPIGSMVKDEAVALLELENRIGERVAGQDYAIQELANSIRSSKVGVGNPEAPLGVFLFTGPSGVGKTESALALADILFGGEKFMTVINMSEYQEKHTVSQLKGSPPGYVGYGEGGILTEAVRQKPYSVVILDEVEKAHLEVMNLFYQVFDKGIMRDGEGREINFRNTIIIMTSNLASDTIIELSNREEGISDADLIESIRPELSAHFKPALLARCKIIPFRPLSKEVLRAVVAIKLDKIAQRLQKAHGISFSCSPELVDQIAESCTAVEAGARNADAVIDKSLLPSISRQLLMHLGDTSKNYSRLHIGATPEGEFEILFSDESGIEESKIELKTEENQTEESETEETVNT